VYGLATMGELGFNLSPRDNCRSDAVWGRLGNAWLQGGGLPLKCKADRPFPSPARIPAVASPGSQDLPGLTASLGFSWN
jgi:hypothetical protein